MKKPSSLSALISKPLLLTSFSIFFAGIFCHAQSLTALFTADKISGCAPLTVQFTDGSTPVGTITSWTWDLGKGDPVSHLQHAGATYTQKGTYTVKLTVSNGTQTDTKTMVIEVYKLPTPNFSFDNPSGCTPLRVKFKDESDPGSGVITEWLWTFGDGGSSTLQNPLPYTFTSPGDKIISLKVKNQYGCQKTGSALNSTISVTGPTAGFTADATTVCQVPATIKFTNASIGSNLTYKWDFKDGSAIDTSPSPPHEFKQAGSYEVELKARDVSGCESSHSLTINVGNEGGLDFTASPLKICSGETVSFTESATSSILSKEWDFGNGAVSSATAPTVTYTSLTTKQYSVTLTAQLQGKTCQSKVTKIIEVVALPKPNFTYKADCNYNVTFTSTSTNTNRVEWYIESSLASTQKTFSRNLPLSGAYAIMLIAYNSLNCADTLESSISIVSRPLAAFSPAIEQDCMAPSLSGCAPFNLQLTNLSTPASGLTYLWRFGHAATSSSPATSTEKNPLHEYAVRGRYKLTLIATNTAGCKDSISSFVNVEKDAPVVKFSISKTKVCAREDITFKDESANATFWCWDFGDDSPVISGKEIKHSYLKPGLYSVTLTAKNAGCPSTLVKTNVIEVVNPFIFFEVEPKDCGNPRKVTFSNPSYGYDNNSLKWDLGDGQTSTDTNPIYEHLYTTPGNYTVTLKGTNVANGCSPEHKVLIAVQEVKAVFTLDNPRPCKGDPVNFINDSKYAATSIWNFGSNGGSGVRNPTTSFSQPGSYPISLDVYDSLGCHSQALLSTPLVVPDIDGNFSYAATSTCDELTVNFTDLSVAFPAIQSWTWDFGNSRPDNISKETLQNPPGIVYDALGTYAVRLKLTNTAGDVCNYVKENAISFTNPIPDFFTLKPEACIDEMVTLNNTSAYATSFKWDFMDGREATDTHASISYSATGPYTIRLTADDGIGCKQWIERKHVITITKPVAKFNAINTQSDCPPLATTFVYEPDASGSTAIQWNWSFGDGKFSVLPSPAYTYLKPGNFDVSLRVTDSNGCSDTTVVEKLVQVGGPYGNFYNGIPGGTCILQNVLFSALTTNAVKHVWDFGDGTVTEQGTEISHTYFSGGFYTASLVLIDANGCKVAAEGNGGIIIYDTTAVDFSYAPKCIFETEPFVLEASAKEDIGMSWEWAIENTIAGAGQQLAMALDSAAEFKVTLHAINEHGCSSSVSHILPVHGNLTFIPNVFTPNSDGYNTSFVIPNAEKSQWDLKIFNRWGYPVYEKDNYASDWDGGDADTGVYYYYVVNSFCKDRSFKGIISIMR